MSTSLTVTTRRRNDWPDAVASLNDSDTDRPRDADEQHIRMVRWFEEAEQSQLDARQLAMRDRCYVDGDQWTTPERDELRKRGQPIISINYCRRKLDLLCGLERKARTDPKAFPRTPAEDERADAATQALRYVADDNDFQALRSQVFDNMLVEGFGGLEVGLEDDGQGGANITLAHVPWDRIWVDPHCRQPDMLDARYLGIVIWMDRDQLEDTYPDADDVIEGSFAADMTSQFRDRPDYMQWTDNNRVRCRVVQCHWSDRGEWYSATFTKAGYLTQPRRSMFKDRKGKSACSLILQSAYIDQDNNRYGMIRDLISLQDEINKRRSKALHLLSVHQVVAEQGAVQDVDHARREVAKPDGYIEVTPGMKFEIESGGDMATGQFQLLQHATQEMQLSGPNAAMSGTDPRELSGRAILAQQAGGAVQNEPLADSLRMWARRVYEMCWMAAREYWTAGKWVRVTDDLNDTRWVGINRPITLQDELAQMPEQQRAMAMQRLQLVPGDPRLQQVIRVENDITDLDVDITIAEGNDIPTMQAENFQTLVQLAGMQPGLIPGEVLIAASSLRNKDDLLSMMKQHMQQQGAQQQAAAQIKTQQVQAGIAKDQGQAAANFALAGERKHNVIQGMHGMQMDLNAPPDNPPGAQQPTQQQMTPDMALAHQMADLATKHANIRNTQAKTAQALGGAPGPEMMGAHASGGLVTRTIQPDTWMGSLPSMSPQALMPDTQFRAIDPNAYTTDQMAMQYNYPGHTPGQMPPQWWGGPNREAAYMLPSHATGGPISQMTGPDPPGPDTGFITAKPGEFVVQQSAVARYGPELLNAINAGAIDPKVLQMAGAHAAADLAKKRADLAATHAGTINTMVTTNRLARSPLPAPAATQQGNGP